MHRLAGSLVPVLSQLARLALVGGAVLALVASSEAGDRAGGACPVGETCAPGTPDGLLFEGAPLGVWPALSAHTIAAGGRQTFRITWPVTHEPFDLAFVAKVTSPDHEVVATGSDRVSVAATGAATGDLRIVDGGGLLYDRLSIDSAEIASIRAAAAYASAYPSIDPPRFALFAGGDATVTVVLADGRGATIVDEDLALRTTVPSQRTSWDSFAVTAPLAAGTLELAIDAGDLVDRRVRVPVVNGYDDVQVMAPSSTGVGGDITVCFSTWRRGESPGPDDDVLVVGAPRQYRITGPAMPLATQPWSSCLELHTTGAGTVQIDATIAGRPWAATIEVRGSSARTGASLIDALTAPLEGDRAILAAEQE